MISLRTSLLLLFYIYYASLAQAQQPNILLIIADDLGVDAIKGFQDNSIQPTTPHLDALRAEGITFKNVWAAPVCTPTRAAIMTGQYGVKTGVMGVPGTLDPQYKSLFQLIEEEIPDTYANALIGKWHLSSPIIDDHPQLMGVDYYAGSLRGAVGDYFDWSKNINGVDTNSQEYLTTDLTNESIDWINSQTQPWFLWLAHNAAHSPFHVPPADLYTISPTGNNRRQYAAMIEAMDSEIGRLLESIPSTELEKTFIIFIGDNGTPGQVIQNYPSDHAKTSIYEGGVHVPMIISGAGVTRKNETENALIHAVDLHATIMELIGTELPGGIFNSLSFDHLLSGELGPTRDYNYSETVLGSGDWHWTIRNDRYKLLNFNGARQEFYDLLADSLETNNLISNLTTDQQAILADLAAEAATIQGGWSCRDHIKNGLEMDIDCGGDCAPCMTDSVEEPHKSLELILFPNPVTDYLTIQSASHTITGYLLHTTDGIVVSSNKDISTEVQKIETSNLASGNYSLEVELDGTHTLTRLVTVIH